MLRRQLGDHVAMRNTVGCYQSRATPDLVFGHLRLEGILLLVQVDLLGHPRERIVSPVLFR